MESRLSVIVPAYNCEDFIERCITSILNQTYNNLEVIVVDDGSTDKSYEIISNLAKKDKRVKCHTKKNEGAGLARTYGLAKATGKYIGFVDSDDYVSETMYEILINILEKEKCDVVSCFSDNEKIDKNKQIEFFTGNEIKEIVYGMAGNLPEIKEDLSYGMSVWRSVYKKDIIDKNSVKFLSERKCWSEDLIFNLNYYAGVSKAAYIYRGLYYYNTENTSLSNTFKNNRIDVEFEAIKQTEKIYKNKYKYDDYKLSLIRMSINKAKILFKLNMNAISTQGYRKTINNIHKILNNMPMRKELNTYNFKNVGLGTKIFGFLIKHKKYNSIFVISYIRYVMRKLIK